jgi:hypothetical protein
VGWNCVCAAAVLQGNNADFASFAASVQNTFLLAIGVSD